MSFTQGLSGLNAASKNLEVVGNNVANANTVGFKGSQAQFGDVFAAALSGANAAQIGIGVKVQTVAQQFTQGNMSVTNNALDMAVNGPGFFVVDTGHGVGYSRNGQFQLDKSGFIVSSAGHKLQGYAIDPISQKPVGSPTALSVPTTVASAQATGTSAGAAGVKGIVAGLNLDSRAMPPALAFNPANPTTYNNSTSTTTYDSKGVAQTTTMYFVKQSNPLSASTVVNAAAPAVGATVKVASVAGLTVGQPVVGSGFPAGTTVTSVGSTFTTAVTLGSNAVTPPIASIANLAIGQAITGANFPAGTTIASLTGGGPTTASITAGSTTVTGATAGLVVGQSISGTGIPAGATITAINALAGTYTISGAATATNAAAALTTGNTGFTTNNAATATSAAAAITVDTGLFTTSNSYTGTLPLAAPISMLADVANTWQVYTTVTDPTTGASLFPNPAPAAGAWAANGILTFNSSGRYNNFLPNDAANNPNNPVGAQNGQAPAVVVAGTFGPINNSTSISLQPAGAAPETIPFDFATSTQFGAAFGVTKLTQDGYTAGQLSGFSIGADGLIQGRYSNGVTKPLGQVALATFPNMQGLQPLGSNEWAEASASGAPVVGAPGTGNNGVLQTSSTEDSNVDLTAELVNMMTAQRVYQANAQTIKTQDQIMQTLVNMK